MPRSKKIFMGEIFYIKKKFKKMALITNVNVYFLFMNNFKGDNKNQRTFQVILLISRKN